MLTSPPTPAAPPAATLVTSEGTAMIEAVLLSALLVCLLLVAALDGGVR